MGSTIGDYVHYHAKNYIQWGINRVGEEGSSGLEANSIFIAQTKKIETSMRMIQNMSMSPQERLVLEQKIMNVMRPPEDDTKELYNRVWEALVPYFESEFEDGIGIIRRDTANIYANATVPDLTRINTNKNNTNIFIGTIAKRVQAIYKAFESVSNNSAEKKFLQRQLEQLEDVLYNLSIIGEKNLLSAGLPQSLIDNKTKIPITTAQPVIDMVNKLLAVTSGTVNLQKGTLFEDMIAVAPYIGKNLSLKEIQNAIKESVVGTTGRTSVSFDPTIFTNEADLSSILGKNYSYSINDNLWKAITTSQDKVDVKLDWRGDGSKILVSAKNVNLGPYSKGIHLVSSMSLLSALTALDNISFVNHFLNINSSTYKTGINLLGNSIYTNSKLALNISILEEAFRGYKGTEKAEVFIINDNQTGKVSVFDIPTLIIKALEAGDFTNGTVKIEPDTGSFIFANYWASTFKERIARLLSTVHSYKINVTLQPWFFN